MFASSIAFATVDRPRQLLGAIRREGADALIFRKYAYHTDDAERDEWGDILGNLINGHSVYDKEKFFLNEDVEAIAEISGTELTPVFKQQGITIHLQNYHRKITELEDWEEALCGNFFQMSGFCRIDGVAAERLGFLTVGRLPQNSEEIAVPYEIFKNYKLLGFNKADGEVLSGIEAPEDLLGEELPFWYSEPVTGQSIEALKTIVGIVDTKSDSWEDGEDNNGIKDLCFVSELPYAPTVLAAPMPESDAGLLRILRYTENTSAPLDGKDYSKISVDTAAASSVRRSMDSLRIFRRVFLIIGGFFLVFGLALSANFITVSIRDKRRTIGILRSLGASRKHTAFIFALESILCSLSAAGVALIAAALLLRFALTPQRLFGGLILLPRSRLARPLFCLP